MFLTTIYLSKHQKQSNANSYSMDHEKFLAIQRRENEKDRKFRKKHSFSMIFLYIWLSMHFICWRNIYPLLKNLSCFIRENVTIGRYKTWFLTWNEHVNQNLVKQLFLIGMIPKYLVIKSRPWNFSLSYCRTIEISTFYTKLISL